MADNDLDMMAAILEELRKLTTLHEVDRQTMGRPMNREQAADYLGVHPDTLYRWARENRVTYSRLGDGDRAPMRFQKADLDEFLERSKIAAVA